MEASAPAIIDPRFGLTVGEGQEGISESPLDLLMRQIVGGFFVLTDGQGAVSKWGEPAELLFGLEASEALGRPLFGHLVADPWPPAGEAWRGFLERGEAPNAPAQVQLTGINAKAGERFDVELVFIPVKLDEGFDFSLFLEDLGFELPSNLMLARMRQQHPVVVRAFGEALGAPQPWEQQRTAGTLVVFRPTVPTPWVQHELAMREAARAAADAELETQLTEVDPGVQGESIYELEDAAAVVARMLDAFQRIEGLERIAGELPAELEATRREADAVRAQAELAQREAQQVRAGLEEALAGLREDASRADERRELHSRVDRLESDRSELARRLQELRAEHAPPADLDERLQRLEQGGAGTRSDVERSLALVDELRAKLEATRRDAEQRLTTAEDVQRGFAGELREELLARIEEGVDRAADQQPAAVAPEYMEALHARLDEMAGRAAEARALTDAARQQSELARIEIEQTRAEQRDALAQVARTHERLSALDQRTDERLSALDQRTDERLSALDQRTDERLSDVDKRTDERLSALDQRTGERFAVADQRADERFTALDGRVAGLTDGAASLEHGLATTRERLDGLSGDVGSLDAGLQGALAEVRHELSTLREEAERLRSESGALRDTVDEAVAAAGVQSEQRIGDLRTELEDLRQLVAQHRLGFDEARQAAVLARRDAELARRAVESGREAQAADGQRLDHIVQQLFGAAVANSGAGRPAPGATRPMTTASARVQPPQSGARPARPGFDDASTPQAVLGLDGRFQQLNPAFAKLVGYQEDEFTNAKWPSVHDRAVLAEQEQQLLGLAAGALDSVALQSSYMHGQGLMVLVSGALTLVRDADGRPDHLILSAEER